MLDDVFGQDPAVRYLRGLATGKTQTPLLLVGDEGVGRRLAAVETVKEMLALNKGISSQEILQVTHGAHPDVLIVAPEGDKELGVEAVREVVAKSGAHPSLAPFRFFILEGADCMTPAAANAILKTLEESSARSRFFLLAESFDRVIPTIRSRCARVNFRRLPESFINSKLSVFEKDPAKALVYARMGEGSVGRATRYWGANRIATRNRVFELLQQGAQGDLSAVFASVDDLGKDLPIGFRFMTFLIHDLLVCQVDPARIISVDILEDLLNLRSQMGGLALTLWGELRSLHERNEASYLNLAFQLKTVLASTFVRG